MAFGTRLLWRMVPPVVLAVLSVGLSVGSARAQRSLSWPSPDWPQSDPAGLGVDGELLQEAVDYAAQAGGSGMVLRYGQVAVRWGDQRQRYDIKSATKSFGATMLGIAIQDGKIELSAPAVRYHKSLGLPPASNAEHGWLDQLTILHLASQTAGFEKTGGYGALLFPPGTHWHYSDGGPNWLAECITLQYGRDLQEVMFERLFSPMGISRDDLQWRNNSYRAHDIDGVARREFGAGIHANVDALARLGYLYLRQGRWGQQQLLSADFIRQATSPQESVVGLPEWEPAAHGNASDHYGLLWWNNADGALPDVPRDAFWAWGLYDSLIAVIPSLDLVVVRGGERNRNLPRQAGDNHYAVLRPLLGTIVAAADDHRIAANPASAAPYAASPVIESIRWDAPETILRLAEGSDNWPLTWADDGMLYTAYGDGWGFKPRTEKKLSLGFARIEGTPPDVRGFNVRTDTGERIGQGAQGEKASGLVMISGVLYVWVRNADNSQLGWSNDHGATWQWAPWKWTTSFGCPTFLNFGQNYAGARDDYVYVYSPDSPSAYQPADRMILARVPQHSIREQDAYEFFVRIHSNGEAIWSRSLEQRGSVFEFPGQCYRGGVSFNPGLGRYLWCQVLPESEHSQGPRFDGGFGIYDAPEPWGPWTTAYFTPRWDVGPGETSSIPTKWISPDGTEIHLVFSGEDCFSVRKATLKVIRN